jgi:hypothetical protein
VRGRRDPGPIAGIDDDGLQADVMRFMAIIAFCLIAVMALAREAGPLAAPPVAVAPGPTPEPAPRSQPAAPEPAPPAPAPPAAEPVPEPDPAPTPPPPTPDPAASGPVLRFASPADFLRLVHGGAVALYAFREGDVRVLRPGAGFRAAEAPGALYELLPATVPAALRDGLAPGAGGDFAFGIRMPAPMERRVRALVDGGARGALVIDRTGAVRALEPESAR